MTTRTGRGVLILGGPTAAGKTALAIELAERYDAEIVGADSRQIYRDMPIGTAAPTAAERRRIAHHLVGFVDPYERYSAARYVADAATAIAEIHARGKRVIVAGGTGFYLRALCGEIDLASEPDPRIRARIVRETAVHPVDVLHDWLRVRNAARAAAVSARDPYRIGRALEIELAGPAMIPRSAEAAPSTARRLPTLRAMALPYVKLAVRIAPDVLHARIERRTDAMIAAGLLAEAEEIGATAVAADAVGYREALAFAAGWLSAGELRTTLARATRRYAKRQLTWFRAEPGLTWIDPDDRPSIERAMLALNW